MKKFICLVSLCLFLVTSVAFAGINDRFSTLKLEDLQSSISSSAASGLGFAVAANRTLTKSTYTLSTLESKAFRIKFIWTSTDATTISAPARSGKLYLIVNSTGGTMTIRATGTGSGGVSIATTKSALIFHNGSNYERVNADNTP